MPEATILSKQGPRNRPLETFENTIIPEATIPPKWGGHGVGRGRYIENAIIPRAAASSKKGPRHGLLDAIRGLRPVGRRRNVACN